MSETHGRVTVEHRLSLRRYTVAIKEHSHKWIVWDGQVMDGVHDSAVEALASVRGKAEDLAIRGTSSVITVEWHPSTVIGAAAVKVLAERERKDTP